MATYTVVLPERCKFSGPAGPLGPGDLIAECPKCKTRWTLLELIGPNIYDVEPACPKGCNVGEDEDREE
jgi:hypothetical protein